jgi:hypothetical protein
MRLRAVAYFSSQTQTSLKCMEALSQPFVVFRIRNTCQSAVSKLPAYLSTRIEVAELCFRVGVLPRPCFLAATDISGAA